MSEMKGFRIADNFEVFVSGRGDHGRKGATSQGLDPLIGYYAARCTCYPAGYELCCYRYNQ